MKMNCISFITLGHTLMTAFAANEYSLGQYTWILVSRSVYKWTYMYTCKWYKNSQTPEWRIAHTIAKQCWLNCLHLRVCNAVLFFRIVSYVSAIHIFHSDIKCGLTIRRFSILMNCLFTIFLFSCLLFIDGASGVYDSMYTYIYLLSRINKYLKSNALRAKRGPRLWIRYESGTWSSARRVWTMHKTMIRGYWLTEACAAFTGFCST